jgi:hypothetical protein
MTRARLLRLLLQEGANTGSQGEDIEQSDGERWQKTKITSNGEWDTHPFKGEKGKQQVDEEPHHETTKVTSNDELPSKKKKGKGKRTNVPY